MSLDAHDTLAAKQERWKSAQKESLEEGEKVEAAAAVVKETNGHLPIPTKKVRAINGSPPDGEYLSKSCVSQGHFYKSVIVRFSSRAYHGASEFTSTSRRSGFFCLGSWGRTKLFDLFLGQSGS